MDYNGDFDESNYCYYCGMPADTIDHAVPQSILRMIDRIADPDIYRRMILRRRLTVPCCNECNSVIGPKYQKSLEERKKFLKSKLKRRYKKLLAMPDWTEREISEMGDHMRDYIRDAQRLKDNIVSRIHW